MRRLWMGTIPLFLTTLSWAGTPTYREAAPVGKLRVPYLTPWALKLAAWGNRRCIWSIPTEERVVALTFDDGPSMRTMPELLRTLKRADIPATFFILGDRVKGTETILRKAVEDGHEIAFHGMTHRSPNKIPAATLSEEIKQLRAIMDEIFGEGEGAAVRFFRPPFGRINGTTARTLQGEGLIGVNASILPGDAHFPKGWSETPERTVTRIVRELRPGSIICLHAGEDLGRDDDVFTMENPAKIVELLGPALKAQGYRVALLGELIPVGTKENCRH